MERASEKREGPVSVMAYVMPKGEARILKVDDFNWLVAVRSLPRPSQLKVLPCISLEHAIFVFDGCVDQLKEWKN